MADPNLGQLADRNFALTATLSEGAFVEALPLGNLKKTAQWVEKPARTADLALASTRFEAVLAAPRAINLIAVWFHTFSLAARYRLTVAGVDGDLDAPQLTTDWTDVYPRLFDSEALEWEDANWWTGQALAEDIDLFKRHLWILLSPSILTTAFRLEFDDQDNTDGYVDLGGLYVATTWQPETNFERGRPLEIEPRALVDEGPSGRLFGEEREGRRRLTVAWKGLTDAEARRLFDAGKRCGQTQPVAFIPSAADSASLYREAYPATFEKPPAPTFNYPKTNAVSATFREILA